MLFQRLLKPKHIGFETLLPTQLSSWLEDEAKDFCLLDVRTPEEYKTQGHIPGARLLPLQALERRLEELPRDKPIVLVCLSGGRSAAASELLVSNRFEQVYNLRGGMLGWSRAGLQTMV